MSFTLRADAPRDASRTLFVEAVEIRRGTDAEQVQRITGLDTLTRWSAQAPGLEAVDLNFDGFQGGPLAPVDREARNCKNPGVCILTVPRRVYGRWQMADGRWWKAGWGATLQFLRARVPTPWWADRQLVRP